MNNKYIGIHSNDLNRTRYGEIVLYVEGQPVGFFSSSGDFVISGSLGIGGITNVSASIAAAASIDTGSFMLTGSVSGDTITFTKGDGTTFQTTITNVLSASYASTSSYSFFAVSASYATTASYTTLAVSASSVKIVNAGSDNEIKYIGFTEKVSGYDDISISTNLRFIPFTSTLQTNTFLGDLQGSASYALTASYVPTSSYALTASYIPSVSFDGNRPVTQPLLPSLVNYNPETSTVVDFLEKVFYPEEGFGIEILANDPFYILDTELSGSHIRGIGSNTPQFYVNAPAGYYAQYITASFTANTPVTWSLQSNSVLDIEPLTGKLILKLNLSGSSTYQAPTTLSGTVIANATSGGSNTRNFTVNVLDNAAPTITTTAVSNYAPFAASFVTASGARLGYIYISEPYDPAGNPTITSMGGPDASKFTFTQYDEGNGAKYYYLYTSQALNSGSYSLSFTGSDVQNQLAYATLNFEVAANTPPSQSVWSIGSPKFTGNIQDFSIGSTFGYINVADNRGDSIVSFTVTGSDASKFDITRTYTNFTPLSVNGTHGYDYDVGRYRFDFNEAPTVGVYDITGSATDSFGLTSIFPISNSLVPSVPNGPYISTNYKVIESAVSGARVVTVSDGIDRPTLLDSQVAKASTNQPVSWSFTDNSTGLLAISGSDKGYITLAGNVSGSVYTYAAGQAIDATIKATNFYGVDSAAVAISVEITDNTPPAIGVAEIISSVNNYYTKDGGAGFGRLRVHDPQTIENVQLISLTGPDAAHFTTSSETPGQDIHYTLSSSVALNSGSYTVYFSASDSFGQFASREVTFTVTPNNPPVITGGPFTVDYSLATTGDTIGSVSVADGDGGIDGIASFTLTGTDSSKFTPVLTNTATNLTKTYNINAAEDLALGFYNLSGSATDGFGNTTTTPIQITINAAAPSIPQGNDPFYLIESAVSGAAVYINSNGFSGTQAQFTTNQVVTWSLSTGTFLAIDSNGRLSAKVNISGSSKQAGNTITDFVTATNAAGVSSSPAVQFTVNIADDLDPVITSGLTTSINNNQTTAARSFGTITISDPQSLGNVSLTDFNGPDVGSFSFTAGAAGSTRTYAVSSSAALNSGSYSFSVTGSDSYNQQAKQSFTITVIENLPPTLTQTGFTKTTVQAINGATIGTIVAADPQDDSISSFSLSGTDSSKFTAILASSTATSKTYSIKATENLSAASYNLTASATDSFGLTTTEPVPVTVTAAIPTVTPNNTIFYVIESALSGALVYISESGFSGVQADLYSDQDVTWSFSGTNTYLAVDSSGSLSVKTNISGSAKNATPGNDTISEYIIATNTAGESSAAFLTNVKVRPNYAPVLTYTGLTVVSGSTSANGETVGTVTATDQQALDSITSIAITGGTDAAKFALVQTGATSYTKTYNINAAQDLGEGNYSIELTATDSFNKQTVDTKTITVTGAAAATETIYIYGQTIGATAPVPDKILVLGYNNGSVTSGSFIDAMQVGALGNSSVFVNGGTTNLITSASLSDLGDLDTIGSIDFSTGGTVKLPIFLFPSGSVIGSQPSSMYTLSTLPATSPVSGRYALWNADPSLPVVQNAGIFYFDLDAGVTVNGYSRWGMIYGNSSITSNNPFYIIPDSGSAP